MGIWFSNGEKREFVQAKLSEMAARSDQVSNAMQIALGFIITLTTALLAMLISIGQIINENSYEGLKNAESIYMALQVLFQRGNMVFWAAGAILSFVGSSSNLKALAIHENSAKHYNRIREDYEAIATKLLGRNHFFKKNPALTTIPELSDRIKIGKVEGIYKKTACAFHFLFSVFLACFFESIAMCIVSPAINAPLCISVERLITIPLISAIIGIGSFYLMHKKASKVKK